MFVNLFEPLPVHRLDSQSISIMGNIFDFCSVLMGGINSTDRFFLLTYIEKEQFVESQRLLLSRSSISILENMIEQCLLNNGIETFINISEGILSDRKQLNKLLETKISEKSKFKVLDSFSELALLGKAKSYGEELFGNNYTICKDKTFEELINSDNDTFKILAIRLLAKYLANQCMQPKLADERFQMIENVIFRMQLEDIVLIDSVISFQKKIHEVFADMTYLFTNKKLVFDCFRKYVKGLNRHFEELKKLFNEKVNTNELCKDIDIKLNLGIKKLNKIDNIDMPATMSLQALINEISNDENIECFMHSESLIALFYNYQLLKDNEVIFTYLDMCPVCEATWSLIAERSKKYIIIGSLREYYGSSNRHNIQSFLVKNSLATLEDFAKEKGKWNKDRLKSYKALVICGLTGTEQEFRYIQEYANLSLEQKQNQLEVYREKLDPLGQANIKQLLIALNDK